MEFGLEGWRDMACGKDWETTEENLVCPISKLRIGKEDDDDDDDDEEEEDDHKD